MKKIRILLTTSAVLLAIGGAFASQFVPTFNYTYYKFDAKIESGEIVLACLSRILEDECVTSGSAICSHPAEPTIQLRPYPNPAVFCGPGLFRLQ